MLIQITVPAQSFFVQLFHTVGEKKLQVDSGKYFNQLNQPFTISKFKYYISNICITNSSGKIIKSDQSFLIDEEEEGSKKIILPGVPKDNYRSIEFIVGVDSLHNCSGAQSGALDPLNGMYWAWNTGYIFLKLEGKSPQSTLPAKIFEYHIGGYKFPNNCIRKIVLPLQSQTCSTIIINVDIAKMLSIPVPVDFAKYGSITDSKNSALIANNYATMFSVLKQE